VNDIDRIREDIATATRMACMAAGRFAREHRTELAACSPAAREDLVVQAVVGYLLGHGLATIAPGEAWQQFLPGEIAEPYNSDLIEALAEAKERWA
jgi:hypothetical protein